MAEKDMATPNGEEIGFSDEQMLDQFQKLSELGVIEYVLPTEPLGESWVVGYAGRIAKMDGEQAACFLLGSTATAQFMNQRLGYNIS